MAKRVAVANNDTTKCLAPKRKIAKSLESVVNLQPPPATEQEGQVVMDNLIDNITKKARRFAFVKLPARLQLIEQFKKKPILSDESIQSLVAKDKGSTKYLPMKSHMYELASSLACQLDCLLGELIDGGATVRSFLSVSKNGISAVDDACCELDLETEAMIDHASATRSLWPSFVEDRSKYSHDFEQSPSASLQLLIITTDSNYVKQATASLRLTMNAATSFVGKVRQLWQKIESRDQSPTNFMYV